MQPALAVYHALKEKVTFLYHQLRLSVYVATAGRKLAVPLIDILTLALYKQTQNIKTKVAIWRDFKPPCSYKTLVVSINRFLLVAVRVLLLILRKNREHAHLVKHTDGTDIPVCLAKNAKSHRTMRGFASWGYSGKGLFYGLKLYLTSDLKRQMLSILFTPGNTHGTKAFMQLNKDTDGVVIADAEFVSEKLQREFYQEHRRLLFAHPRKNMKKISTRWQRKLYETRVMIEFNFRDLKMFYGLETSVARSVDGTFANYFYALLAYALR